VTNSVMAIKKSGRPERAEAFAAGYQKAKLKGGVHSFDRGTKKQVANGVRLPL
jgi:hypothetical protein